MAAKNNIPIPYLRECFRYDPESGVLRWRERPLRHFPDERAQRSWNTRLAHTEAGQITAWGYRLIAISIDGKRHGVYAHRAAWALHTGEYPPFEIDHDDRNYDNNRFKNLKPATHAENHQNRRNVRGTTLERRTGRYFARIHVGDRTFHLGTFDTEAEAHQAYLDAKLVHHQYKPTQ
jgi:hypothetical protein